MSGGNTLWLVSSFALLGALPCASIPDPRTDPMGAINKGVSEGGQIADTEKEAGKCDRFATDQVSLEEEQAFGGALAVKLAKMKGMYVDASRPSESEKVATLTTPSKKNDVTRYVNVVGKTVAAVSPRAAIKWKFGVLDDAATVNAWSAPGGYVFITSGALKKVTSEDQLAGILAHEVGHVVLRHALKRYGDNKVSSCKAIIRGKYVAGKAASEANDQLGAVDPGNMRSSMMNLVNSGSSFIDLDSKQNLDALTDAAEHGSSWLHSGFEDQDELAADRVAVDLLMASGYSVQEYTALIGGISSSATFMANHPTGAERVKAMVAYMKSKRSGTDADPFLAPEGKKHALGDELKGM